MKITTIAVILLLGILLVSGLACGGGLEATPTPTPTLTPTPTPTATPMPEVQILYHDLTCEYAPATQWTVGFYDCDVTGVVKNTGTSDAEWVTVYADFFDVNNIRIKTGLDFIGDLGAGQSAYFDVFYYDERYPDHYEIWVEYYEW